MIALGVLLVAAAVLLLGQAAPANAQCGTQASSCKNCHEVQGKKSVNKDGTGWHQSHAFGDFCANCHAGNVQSMVAEEAHQGMVKPMSDVQASCGSCHPTDLMDRAKVYATKLGVEVGVAAAAPAGGGAPVGEAPSSGTTPSEVSSGSGEGKQPSPVQESKPVEPAAELVTGGGEVIDYGKRYDETAGGVSPINWGNIILIVLIIAMVVGGGAFVLWNEQRLRPTGSKAEKKSAAVSPAVIEDIPPEVAALLLQLLKLNPAGRRALANLLENPDEASELLYSISQLDPELLRRIRNLDARARALLLALAGQ
jgi:hypothetical protein